MSDDTLKKLMESAAKIASPEFMEEIDRISKESKAKREQENLERVTGGSCDHGISFDEDAFKQRHDMSATEVRKRWPRLFGACPKGCGFNGIGYASGLHYVAGDW